VTGSGRARMSAREEAVIDEGEESARVHGLGGERKEGERRRSWYVGLGI